MFMVVKPQKAEEERAGEGERHGAEEHDERIAEALELRGEHEEDQDEGNAERHSQAIALGAELPRLAGVIDGEALRQNLFGFVFEHLERHIERHAGRDGALDLGGIELLEPVQFARLRAATRCWRKWRAAPAFRLGPVT